MELDVRWLGLEPSPALRRQIGRRLRHTLRPFQGRVDQVTVRVLREHGRGRNTTYVCALQASAPDLPHLLCTQRDHSLRLACSRAAVRLRRGLARKAVSRRQGDRWSAVVGPILSA